jgi:hypothetical protein
VVVFIPLILVCPLKADLYSALAFFVSTGGNWVVSLPELEKLVATLGLMNENEVMAATKRTAKKYLKDIAIFFLIVKIRKR